MTFPNNIPVGYCPPSTVETLPANPTAPASTSAYKMQGLGALVTPGTPVANILALIQATINAAATTAGNGINLQLWYGAVIAGVGAPANGAAIPANAVQIGSTVSFAAGTTLTAANDLLVPVSLHGLARSLAQGQQYWFDVAAESIGAASDNALVNVAIDLVEIA